MTNRFAPAKAIFFLAAAPIVWATARRVARMERTLPFNELIDSLRRRQENPLPKRLARPTWLAGTVEVLLPHLPAQALGPCLRRALILLELWSRCGLEPKLHIGLKPSTGLRDAHAWLTAEESTGEKLSVSSALDFEEAFVL